MYVSTHVCVRNSMGLVMLGKDRQSKEGLKKMERKKKFKKNLTRHPVGKVVDYTRKCIDTQI